jgi:hypothetical protein
VVAASRVHGASQPITLRPLCPQKLPRQSPIGAAAKGHEKTSHSIKISWWRVLDGNAEGFGIANVKIRPPQRQANDPARRLDIDFRKSEE